MVGFNTQPPEGSWQQLGNGFERHRLVSTHSRPKAAGLPAAVLVRCRLCFNTQPPEGGWTTCRRTCPLQALFQHTAARRRLAFYALPNLARCAFQHTAARRRLEPQRRHADRAAPVSTHSRPKAAGGDAVNAAARCRVSTHSRPKAAGYAQTAKERCQLVSTHSRPKAAGSCLPPSPFG